MKKKVKVEFEGHTGVWRTINGSHIFIRDGEDVKTAMARHRGEISNTSKKESNIDEYEKDLKEKLKNAEDQLNYAEEIRDPMDENTSPTYDEAYQKYMVAETNYYNYKNKKQNSMPDFTNSEYVKVNGIQDDQEANARQIYISTMNRAYEGIKNKAGKDKADAWAEKSKNDIVAETPNYIARIRRDYDRLDDENYNDIEVIQSYNRNRRLDYPNVFSNYNTQSYGVNWGAYGTMTPQESKEYASMISEASSFADKVNKEIKRRKKK